MTIVAKLFECERKIKKIMFNKKWFPILAFTFLLLLCGWDTKCNIREGLLAVGFFLLGFVIGGLYARRKFYNVLHSIKERTSTLIEDLVSDLSRYAIIAGESYIKTKEMIHKYKKYAESILNDSQQK